MKKILSILFFVAISYNVAQAQLITTSQGVRTTHKPTIKKQNAGVKGFEQMAEGTLACADGLCLGADYIAGYRFNDYFFLGGGTGIEFEVFEGILFFPKLYLHTRGYFTKKKVKPFVGASIGINAEDFEYEKVYANLQVGMSCYINKNIDWTLSGGFCYNGYGWFQFRTGFTF